MEIMFASSFTSFPTEVQHAILSKLPGRDLVSCRAVCQSLKDAVDSLGDFHWKQVCENELQYCKIYKAAQETSSLTWCGTFRALNSWNDIQTAAFNCRALPPRHVKQIRILPNRTIAMLTQTDEIANDDGATYGDAIVYYNIDTLQEITSKTYEHNIDCFDENADLLVLSPYLNPKKLTLIEKLNGKHQYHLVRNVRSRETLNSGDESKRLLLLIGQTVYLQPSEEYVIYASELRNAKDGSFITPVPVQGSKKFIRYMHRIDKADNNDIYSDNKLFINLRTELRKYSCDWTSPKVRAYCESLENIQNINRIKIQCVCLHGSAVLLGTRCYREGKSRIEIYLDPFDKYGELIFENSRPRKVIDLDDLERMILPAATADGEDTDSDIAVANVMQIEVVEAAEHHVVIAYDKEKVFVLTFEYDVKPKTPPRQPQIENTFMQCQI